MEKLRCFGCMKLKTGRPECEHCGYDERTLNAPHQLQPGTVLQNQYVVGRVLGQGGFGITYMGWDSFLEVPIAIKEYYPNTVVTRNTTHSPAVYLRDAGGKDQYTNNLRRFAKEARALAKLDAEERLGNIVRVHNLVQANNTAYIIMEFVAGVELRSHIQKNNRPLTPRETLDLLLPLMLALDKVHAHGMIHRDISPDNIMVLPDGTAKLIDFGASHLSQMDDAGNQKSTEAIVKHGFAPMEQYSRKGKLGPWTDVYAMCATVYYCLTGAVLPPVMDRAFYDEEIDWSLVRGLSSGQLQTLKDGLALNTSARIQSMAQLHDRLLAAEEPETEEEPEILPEQAEPDREQAEPEIPLEAAEQRENSAVFATVPVQEAGDTTLLTPEVLNSDFAATEPVQEEAYTTLLPPEQQANFGIAPTVPVEQEWAEAGAIVSTVPVEEHFDMESTAPVEEELPLPGEIPEEGETEPEIPQQEDAPAEEPEQTEPAEEPDEVPEEEPELPIEEVSQVSEEEPVEAEEEPEPVIEDVAESAEEQLPPEQPGEEISEIPAAETEPELPEQEEEPAAEPEAEIEPIEEQTLPDPSGEESPEAPEEESAEEPEPVMEQREEPAILREDPREETPGIAVAVVEAASDSAPAEEPRAPAKPRTRKGKGKLWLAAAAAVLVCVIGAALFKISTPGTASPAGKPAAVADPDAWRDNVLVKTYHSVDSTIRTDYVGQPIYGSQIRNDQVKTVTFLDTLADEPKDSWDVSLSQDGSVKAWVKENGQLYDLYIAGEGGINGAGACRRMFTQFTQLEEVSFGTAFHTEEAVDMEVMFQDCRSLKNLDLTGFDTANVTNMRSMFSGCESLKSLDVSSFDTANVTDMSYMFQVGDDGSSQLETLNVSSFNTAEVTDMSGMFSGLGSLTALDVSGFDTAKVTDMDNMFMGCKSLTELDLGSFNTSQVVGMKLMFRGCESLTSLDLSGFDTFRLTSMSGMFSGCKGLESLNLSNFNTAGVKSMGHMFHGCESLKSLDVSSFDTANVTDMQNMFQDCKGLTALDLSNFNTASVKYMSQMFHGCESLASLNVSSFDTSKVSGMDKMFAGCKSLKSLSLSNFNITRAWPKWDMFKDCQMPSVGHRELGYLLAEAKTRANAWRGNVLMSTYGVPVQDIGWPVIMAGTTVFRSEIYNSQVRSVTFLDTLEDAPADSWDVSAFNNGSVKAWAEKSAERYDLYIAADGGINGRQACSTMFVSFSNLEEVNFGDAFHTEEVTDMDYMFRWCGSLTDLDLGNFETQNVRSMRSVFEGCRNLESLNLGNFNTRNVANMDYLFADCESLTELDLESFNTANVTDMQHMFKNCKSLAELDLSSFDTARLTNMSCIFQGCKNLESLDLGNFNTRNVVYMDNMFAGCEKLESLNLRSFHTAKVTMMIHMFQNCKSLTELDLSSFDTASLLSSGSVGIFSGCSKLKDVNHPDFNKLLG